MGHGGTHVLDAAVEIACGLAVVPAGLRWLRVAQREHYLFDAASRFALRWWRSSPLNVVGFLVAAVGIVLGTRWPATTLATAAVVVVGPVGLGVRGRTSPLAWTRRLRTLAATWAALQAAAVAAGVAAGVGPVVAGGGPVMAGGGALAVPALVDVACALTSPVERRLAGRFVFRAAQRLRRMHPTVVAVTGSYGKTTTKGYIAHLLSGSKVVVASPASFNNRAGLARAVNEHLSPGTDVFVAEMGTYGRGEIAELCRWIRPDVSVITAIGPVHLERFRTEDAIVEAKAEILESAGAVVLAVDDARLAALADRADRAGKTVWRVSAGGSPDEGPGADDAAGEARTADVVVTSHPQGLRVEVRGEHVADVAVDARPTNVACAVAVALQLDVPVDEVVSRLPTLPTAPHRLEAAPTADGRCLVLDDTYNANPAGALAALEALERLAPPGGRRAVVTPGMVELGRRQAHENARFAEAVAGIATDLVVVGRTNRRALVAGAHASANGESSASPDVVVVATREEGVAWVRANLGEGDVALFENDLPDHYP